MPTESGHRVPPGGVEAGDGADADPRNFNRKHFEAIARTALGEVSLVSERWSDGVDVVGTNPVHHVQLSLKAGAKHATGRFLDRWAPHRFARVGPLFLFPAHEAIHARSDIQIQRSIVCRLDPNALSRWFETDFAWTDHRLERCLDIGSRTVQALLTRLGDELRHPGFGGTAMIELIVAQASLELSRYFRGIEDTPVTGGLAPWRLDLIDERLASQAGTASLAELAALCDLSVRHLTRAFRASRGRSLGDHMAVRRIEEARHMLRGGMSIKETAFAAGFGAPTNFSAAFRRATGKTPRGYRRSVTTRES